MNKFRFRKNRKIRFPGRLTRFKWFLFPKSRQMGYYWYHIIFPKCLLKKFRLEFTPWTYKMVTTEI